MNRRNWKPFAAALGVVGAGTALLVPMVGAKSSAPSQTAAGSASKPPPGEAVRVETAKPEQRPLTQVLKIPASLEPGEMADLFAKTSGYILKVHVDIGSRAQKDDVLLEIDVPEMHDELRQAEAVRAARKAQVLALQAKAAQADSLIATARAELNRAEAELALGRITVQRKKQLFEEKAIPQQELDEAESRLAVVEAEVQNGQAKVQAAIAQKAAVEAEVDVAKSHVGVEEANVARLETLMAYATIRAPFDGVITERHVDPGAFVRSAVQGAATPLLKIVRLDYLRLVMHVPESDAPHVGVGTPIEAECKALGTDPLRATVTRTAMALREETRTMRIEADINIHDRRLVPGLYARASVLLASEAQAMMIPSKAVRVRGANVTVLVVDGAVVRAKPITLGYDDGVWAEVKSGLTGQERIIVSAAGSIAPGAAVVFVESEL
jgi:RND family efflux transporter MFP subunit